MAKVNRATDPWESPAAASPPATSEPSPDPTPAAKEVKGERIRIELDGPTAARVSARAAAQGLSLRAYVRRLVLLDLANSNPGT